MSWKDNNLSYGIVSKFLHWLVFLLVLAMIICGFIMHDLDSGPTKGQVYNIHKVTGLFILVAMLARIVWRMLNSSPPPPTAPRWQLIAAKANHLLLYLTLLAMPLSGWVMSTAANKLPKLFVPLPIPGIAASKELAKFYHSMHSYIGWMIVALVTIHVVAAMKHHLINKNNVLKRMLPHWFMRMCKTR